MLGVDLPARRTLMAEIAQAPIVERAVRETAREQNLTITRSKRRTGRYAREIAAGFSYPFARLMRPLLGWLWRRLYDAVELHHADDLGTGLEGVLELVAVVYLDERLEPPFTGGRHQPVEAWAFVDGRGMTVRCWGA